MQKVVVFNVVKIIGLGFFFVRYYKTQALPCILDTKESRQFKAQTCADDGG